MASKSMALVLLVATLIPCFVSTFAEFQRIDHGAKASGSLSFLVVGDWGRRGVYNQSQVATQVPFGWYSLAKTMAESEAFEYAKRSSSGENLSIMGDWTINTATLHKRS